MSRNDTMAHYSQCIVNMAKRLDIAAVCASQFSRASEKESRKPRLSDLRDSGSLEQDARQIILLYWDAEADSFMLEVAKNNYGQSGEAVEVIRYGDMQRFEERRHDGF
jgi:replicative DNA helicase